MHLGFQRGNLEFHRDNFEGSILHFAGEIWSVEGGF